MQTVVSLGLLETGIAVDLESWGTSSAGELGWLSMDIGYLICVSRASGGVVVAETCLLWQRENLTAPVVTSETMQRRKIHGEKRMYS